MEGTSTEPPQCYWGIWEKAGVRAKIQPLQMEQFSQDELGRGVALFLMMVFLVGLAAWRRAWVACRETTLRPTLIWAMFTWLTWAGLAWQEGTQERAGSTLRYLSLSLTACAGIAVLGARRPGLGAWNFVVGGLLAILLLPVAEGLGTPRLHPSHLFFLGSILLVSFLNYLPTRFGLAAVVAAAACAVQLAILAGSFGALTEMSRESCLLIGFAPWIAWMGWRTGAKDASAFDTTWRTFRDCYGWLWAQRQRDQFNRAATHGGWHVTLGWRGLEYRDEAQPGEEDLVATLRALLKRFGRAGTNS